MHAMLVVNPLATSTTAAARDVLAHALASELKLDVLQTRYRGHAAEAVAAAVRTGVDLVIAHGGDGTINEVVNGMLEAGVPEPPTLAVLPGGSANVFARALGIPQDPLDATACLLRALAAGSSRTVGLGRADDRWFTFNAGMGWDADVVRSVERARERGLEATPGRYARSALRHYVRQLRRPTSLTVEIPGAEPVTGVRLALVCNTDPWTYLGSRPVRPNPGCGDTDGLALFALLRLGPLAVAPVLRDMLRSGDGPSGSHVLRSDELPLIRVSSPVPVALQVDGDYLGERSEMEFVAVPSALRVVV